MNSTDAKRIVIVGTVGTAVVTSLGSMVGGQLPSARVPVGAFIAGVTLAMIAEAAPGPAAGFAIIMLVTATTVYGQPMWGGVAKVLASPKSSGTSAREGVLNSVSK